eukprot:486917_1
MPRIFKKPANISEAAYLDKIYSSQFKHGWCVTLADPTFEKYYKLITGFDHVSINYNRQILYEEICSEKHNMLCFMDLFHHEMKSKNVQSDVVKLIYTFFQNNEYDTETVVDDILCASIIDHSNIAMFLQSKHKKNEYVEINKIINKYNAKPEQSKVKICGVDDVFDVDKCEFTKTIIDALAEFNKGNDNQTNLSDLIEAYDHIILVHKFCAHNHNQGDDDGGLKISKSFAESDHIQHTSNVQKYMVQTLGGFCSRKRCSILQKHIMRRREQQIEEEDMFDEEDEIHDSLEEILNATLNALHCYIMHEKKQLFRLQGENGNSHFITPVMEANELEDDIIEQENDNTPKSNKIPTINFGQSVLEWLDVPEQKTFESFHDEIVQNPQSTINEKMYLSFAQECFILLNSRKHEHYLLKEMMALKIYTDTNSFQSSLRRSYWKSTEKKVKCSFYNWALQLYKTALYHAKTIPRLTFETKRPDNLYHGLDRVFVLNNARPKYAGPVSMSLEISVAHSFSKAAGLLLNIKSSYSNKFKFLTGITVYSISQHKNEREVLLMDQYMPIALATKFDEDPNNNVDHLMYTIKSYKKKILNASQFYKLLGVTFNDSCIPCSWISFIKTHHLLYDKIDLDPARSVLNVLVEDLTIEQLYENHKVLSSKFGNVVIHRAFNLCCFTMETNNTYLENSECLEHAEYKVECNNKYNLYGYKDIITINPQWITNSKSFNVYVKNEHVNICEYILLQDININSFNIKGWSNVFVDSLKVNTSNNVIVIDSQLIDPSYHENILNSKFVLLRQVSQNTHTHTQHTFQSIIHGGNYLYQFNNINQIKFIIPFLRNHKLNLYVQIKNASHFVFLKTFELKNTTNRIDFILQNVKKHPINNATDFFAKMGCKISDDILTIQSLQANNKLYKPTEYDPKRKVLDVLFEDLHLKQLSSSYTILSSKFDNLSIHKAFNRCSFTIKINHRYLDKYNLKCLENTQYTVECDSKNSVYSYLDIVTINREWIKKKKSCKIYVRNKDIFPKLDYIELQNINLEQIDTKHWSSDFQTSLRLKSHNVIVTYPGLLNQQYRQEILNCKFILLYEDSDSSVKQHKLMG